MATVGVGAGEMFDAVYVINLDRSVHRWENIQRVLKTAGFSNVIRFPAVDERLLGTSGIHEFQTRGMLATDLSAFRASAVVGEIGCALSHALVLDDIIARNLKIALVLEDDVELAGDVSTWRERCEQAFVDLPKSWDLWYLLRCFDFEHRTKRLTSRTVVPFSPQGAAAYAVSAAGALKLRRAIQPVTDACDRVFPRLVRTKSVRAFAASPMLFDPGAQATEIQRINSGKWINDGINRPPEYWPEADLRYLDLLASSSMRERLSDYLARVAKDVREGRMHWTAIPSRIARIAIRGTASMLSRRSTQE